MVALPLPEVGETEVIQVGQPLIVHDEFEVRLNVVEPLAELTGRFVGLTLSVGFASVPLL